MRLCFLIYVSLGMLVYLAAPVRAEKVLIYDEERGIISVDKDEIGKMQREKSSPPPSPGPLAPPAAHKSKQSPNDIHVGRRKDPPELYFKSGLQYFTNDDYTNAVKNFQYVIGVDEKPEYLLWLGKTYRKMGRDTAMISLMQKIVDEYPDSDVADDALFEIAFYRQRELDYHAATDAYARLAEQYPFGLSYSNGHEFLELSRNQRKNMRAEMVTTLSYLGYTQTLEDAYVQFQQHNGLEVTGRADAPTVKAVKEHYTARTQAEAMVDRSRKQFAATLKWGSVAGGVFLLNLLLIFYARVRIKRTRKQLESLQALLIELDTSTL